MNTTPATSWRRSHYGVLLAAYLVFVVYGSLVPLRIERVPLPDAVARFAGVIRAGVVVYSRTDVAVNVLLFIPLAYFMMASLRTDRRGWFGHGAAAVIVLLFGIGLTSAIEFAQIFVRGRTLTLSDILAESTGAALGLTAWLLIGRRVTAWLRALLSERERPAMLQRVLVAFSALYSLSQMMPLDLTVDLGVLAKKYRAGMIVLQPFGYTHASVATALWDYGADVLLAVPLGLAGVLAWTEPGARRSAGRALTLAVAVVAAIEGIQVFVVSRYADITDVLTGAGGAALGVWTAAALSQRPTLRRVSPYSRTTARIARLALPLALGVLAADHWSPYNFSLAPDQVAEGTRRLLQIPFLGYYISPQFGAFSEVARKSLLAVPLGVALGVGWPVQPGERALTSPLRVVLLAAALLALCGIEVGQVFLPTRFPDLTDAFVGEVGVAAGMWAATRVLAARA